MADSNRTLTTIRRRRPPKPKLAESKVLERRDITHDLMLMWIEKPEGFSFKAGQYCTIGREGHRARLLHRIGAARGDA